MKPPQTQQIIAEDVNTPEQVQAAVRKLLQNANIQTSAAKPNLISPLAQNASNGAIIEKINEVVVATNAILRRIS